MIDELNDIIFYEYIILSSLKGPIIKDPSSEPVDPKKFYGIIGSLLYLTINKPYIIFFV